MIVSKIKFIKIDSENIEITNLFNLKGYIYRLSEVVYEDFEFESIYGKTGGILLKLNSRKTITISNYEFSNSDLIIKNVKNNCTKGNGLKIEIWNKRLKIFVFIGMILLLAYIIIIRLQKY